MVYAQEAQYQQETVVEYYKEIQSPLFIGLDSTTLTDSSKKTLSIIKPSAVVLFSNNIHSYEQTKILIKDIHDYGNTLGIDIEIAIDEEGGVVSRLNNLEQYPNFDGCLNGITEEEVKEHVTFIKELGIDINLGPVADIAYDKDSFILLRSPGDSPEQVSSMISLIIDIQQHSEISSTLKHFPGHGRTSIDSHEKLPTINISKQTWLETDAKPFIEGIKSNAEYIMPGHLLYPQIDNTITTHSDTWIKDIVRNELSFEGEFISDDLKMSALNDSYPNRINKTLSAGINHPLLILKESIMLQTYSEWMEIELKNM